jgi:hypothetical protein
MLQVQVLQLGLWLVQLHVRRLQLQVGLYREVLLLEAELRVLELTMDTPWRQTTCPVDLAWHAGHWRQPSCGCTLLSCCMCHVGSKPCRQPC